jgi:hypothetical protein
MDQIAGMWLTVGDDRLAGRSFDKAGEIVKGGEPSVNRRSMVRQILPCWLGEGATGPRTLEVIKSRFQSRSSRRGEFMPG